MSTRDGCGMQLDANPCQVFLTFADEKDLQLKNDAPLVE